LLQIRVKIWVQVLTFSGSLTPIHLKRFIMQAVYASSTRTLWFFISIHILIIAASNYLVQFPFEIYGFHNTWGALVFPLLYLASDLTIRFYGASAARKIILLSMFPALIISYVMTIASTANLAESLNTFNLFAFRIAFASFMAYIIGQIFDIFVFAQIRRASKWWVAPFCSNSLGSLVDTFIFFSIAFFHSSDAFMAENWVEIAWGDYAFKLLMSIALFLPAYGLFVKAVNTALRQLTIKKCISSLQ